jgi:hypothetical protein
MQTQTVKLIDQSRHVVATAQVANEGAYYGGTIDLGQTPSSLHALFEEFEEIVNGQMLSFLDDIQERIAAHTSKAVFESGQEVDIKDLQVYPTTGDLSFKLAEISTPSSRLA